MKFDKNKNKFPSDFHREIWWWAVGLVPPDVSLTGEVKSKCGGDVLDGCHQWYDYFNLLCEDMYNNTEKYAPASARQYRDMLENIAAEGKLRGDSLVWGKCEWEKYCDKLDKSKAYVSSGITADYCLDALKRAGLECEYMDNTVIFQNNKYPKIFHAMNTFEHSPNIRKTPARHHFAHCEFRQLFKSYSASYDELLRRVSDESRYIAYAIHDFAKSLKIQRYIHFDTIKYKHKDIRVMDFSINGGEYPTMRINIGTCANPDADITNDGYYKSLLKADNNIQNIFAENLDKCGNQEHRHQTVVINGKGEQVCTNSRIKINPMKKDLDAALYFISARKESIDEFVK